VEKTAKQYLEHADGSRIPIRIPTEHGLYERFDLPLKTGLPGGSFTGPEELLEGARESLEGILVDELTAIFEGWIDQVRRGIVQGR
jgi:hypothetical protein